MVWIQCSILAKLNVVFFLAVRCSLLCEAEISGYEIVEGLMHLLCRHLHLIEC
ncbi:hypothetical protein M758_8G034200 [Ceratodon purpureus]|nr:hypothetical protein M758_8G034200 [Ceratodon purpureus]